MTTDVEQSSLPIDAIILAAGRGVRMGGERAKVLYEVADRPMIDWVVDACEASGVRRCVVVVGHDAVSVKAALAGRRMCLFVEQREQLGTGHAVMQAQPLYANGDDAEVLVLCGDGPLIRTQTLHTLIAAHRRQSAAATLATAVLDDPTGYGRIIRDDEGKFQKIVEHKDADASQRSVREVNPSYYCFRAKELFEALSRVGNDNAKKEYYLTDVLEILLRGGRHVAVVDAVPQRDVLSINTPGDLACVDEIMRDRLTSGVRS